MSQAKGVEAVDRALEILGCFSTENQELSLAEIARQTGFYKSTILRLAVSLENFGYLVREETGQFRLGPTTWKLGASYRQGFDLAGVLRPELKILCEQTHETASFFIRENNRRICLYRVEPARAIKHSISEGASMPLDRGASGKVLMAYSGDKAKTSAKIRADGHAISRGERDPEVAAISMPLVASSGRLAGAIAVSGLVTRFDGDHCANLIEALKECQNRLKGRISE